MNFMIEQASLFYINPHFMKKDEETNMKPTRSSNYDIMRDRMELEFANTTRWK